MLLQHFCLVFAWEHLIKNVFIRNIKKSPRANRRKRKRTRNWILINFQKICLIKKLFHAVNLNFKYTVKKECAYCIFKEQINFTNIFYFSQLIYPCFSLPMYPKNEKWVFNRSLPQSLVNPKILSTGLWCLQIKNEES